MTATLPTGTTDPMVSIQWHLNNTGQTGGIAGEDVRAVQAWTVSKGENVQVAVTDGGVELLHQDLVQNIVASKSHNYLSDNYAVTSPLPCEASDTHGTAVAGIIGARDLNGTGGAGVAPRSQLLSFNALASNLDSDTADAMTRELATVSVYHNSWGSPDNGYLNLPSPAWTQAIDTGTLTGRGGKGAIYLFAAGNGGVIAVPRSDGKLNYSNENSNFDGYVNKRGVNAVCAVNDSGKAMSFSEPGANLLLCAPSSDGARAGIVTANVNGTGAGALDRYRTDFSGTSASAPMVSGVVALMLAANPNLTWRDVRLVLARSARHNDATSSTWQPSSVVDSATQQPKQFSHLYGFGVANAQEAVRMAASWQSVGNTSSLQSCNPGVRTVNRAIADADANQVPGTTLIDQIAISNCPITKIEFVELTLTAPHTYPGDLDIRLRSPANTASELANHRGCGTGVSATADPCRSQYDGWQFGSVRHMDEGVNGTWQIEITDMAHNDTGTLKQWNVTFYGR